MISYVSTHFTKAVLYDMEEIIVSISKTRKLSHSLNDYSLGDFYEQNVLILA